MALLARDVRSGDFCDIYTIVRVLRSSDEKHVWITAQDKADGHLVYWSWASEDETPVQHPPVDERALAELVKESYRTLIQAREAAERARAWSAGPERAQIDATINLLNQALDAQEDAGQHDDDSEH